MLGTLPDAVQTLHFILLVQPRRERQGGREGGREKEGLLM